MRNMSSDGGGGENPAELLALLNSDNRTTVEQTKALIHENLYTSRDPTLLNALIEFYLETRSAIALQILANLHEGRAHQIFERLNEHLKQSQTRMDTLTLLGHIVRRQPSWLHKMVNTSLFDTLLKQLKSDSDVLILVSGLMIIATLLPLVPTSVGGKLDDLFDIFVRISSFGAFKPGNTPAVHLLHLNVAIYIFFHRLYAMFPNNLLEYLRNKFGGKNLSRSMVFQQVVKPMMEQVRLHPCLVTETTLSEVGKTRWRAKEPHDIMIECEKLSLEPLERPQEDSGYNKLLASQQSLLDTTNLDKSGNYGDTKFVSLSKVKERRMSDSATQTGKSLQFGDSGVESSGTVISADDLSSAWSPAVVCGLCTPPSSQMSPSASHFDLSKSITLDQSLCSTPAMAQTPGESPAPSPTPSLAGDLCVSVMSTKTKNVLYHKNGGSGNEVVSESTRVSINEDKLHKDICHALLQHKETQSSSVPVALTDQRTSTPKFLLRKSAGTEVGCDVVAKDAVISENHKYGHTTERIKDVEVLKSDSKFEDHGQQLMDEPETDSSELDKEHNLCNPRRYHDVTQLEDNSLSERHPSSQTLIKMQNEMIVDDNRTDVVTSCNLDKEFEEENSKSICQTNEELVTESSVMADIKHSETLSADSKDHTNQLENKSTENSFDDACKLHPEPGIMPNARTFLILSSLPWKSSHDSSVLDEIGPGSKVRSKPSPLDILDTFIKLGAGIHVDEIARIPLVSLPGTDWTHYGGSPAVDEIDILRRQIQLLHQQLLYERHKCEQHALRNRRLISKTFKAVQYKEELQATKDHLKLQEVKMKELSDALNKESETNSKLKELTSSWDNQQQTQIRNLLNENKLLRCEKQQAEENLRAQEREFVKQQLEFHQTSSTLFTLENEVKKLKEQLLQKENLNLQVDTISQELLVMGEINQQQKELIKKLSVSECQTPETAIQLQSVSKELSSVKHTVQKQKAEIDAQASKLSDSEVLLSRKDMEIKELKKFTENVKGTYIAKLKALEDKYTAQKKVNQTLESHILTLQAKLDHQHRKTKRTKETVASQTEWQETKSPP